MATHEERLKTNDGSGDPRRDRPTPKQISRGVLRHVGQIARECGATGVLVYRDALEGEGLELPTGLEQRVLYVTRAPNRGVRSAEEAGRPARAPDEIQVPDVSLTRMGQVKIALVMAMSRGLLKKGDTIICLSGLAGSGSLDTIMVMQLGREFEIFVAPGDGEEVAPDVVPEVLERVVTIAAELGSEGREGKPVGALFVIGDTERVLSLSRQIILNPFRGYPPEERNILDPVLEETVKELATIDGAFVIGGDGIVESAGAYLKTASIDDDVDLPQGLGARHHAAAGITGVSEAVAIAVSESTGTVTIFRGGKIITQIEKPRSTSQPRHV